MDKLEEKFRQLQYDYANIKDELYRLIKEKDSEIDFLKENLRFVLNKLDMKFRSRCRCSPCEGTGAFYISPISDCGQSNVCMDCKGKGYIWL